MISPFIIISLFFLAGGLLTLVMGRRLAGQVSLAWLIQVMGGLLLLAGAAGLVSEWLR